MLLTVPVGSLASDRLGWAEIGLVLLLFSDAYRTDPRALRVR